MSGARAGRIARKRPLEGRHGAGRWSAGFNGTAGRLGIVRRLNGHVAVDMGRLLSTVFLVLLTLLVLSRALSIATGEPFPVSVISSGSMEPTLSRGDVVVWTPTRMSDVHAGDIIVFKSRVQPGTVIAHRVIEIQHGNGNLFFITKGDANPDPDQRGLHVPEPRIDSRSYLGKVVGLDGVPLRIPYLGSALFWASGLQGDYFGAPGAEAYPWVLFPLVAAVVIALVAAWLVRPEPESKRRTRAIFPDRKVSVKKYAAVFAVWYVCLLVGSGVWAHDNVDAGVGVNASFNLSGVSRPDLYAEFVQPGTVASASYLAANPGGLPIRLVAVVEGDGAHFFSPDDRAFTLQGREDAWKSVQIAIPGDTKPGLYTARIRVFSSPLWMVLPESFMREMAERDARAAILVFDIAAAVIYTAASVITLALVLFVALALTSRRVEGLALREEGRWAHGPVALAVIAVGRAREWFAARGAAVYLAGKRLLGVSAAEVRAAGLAGVGAGAFSVAVYFANGWTLLELVGTCALSTGVVAVLAGCRFKSEIVLATCISLGMLLVVVLAWPGMAQSMDGSTLVQAGHAVNVVALSLMLFLLFLLPVLLIARLTARLGFRLKERIQRLNGLEPSDL